MNKPIFTLVCAFFWIGSFLVTLEAQPSPTTIFTFDSISIIPANPTPTETISIQVFGTKWDSCVYLGNHTVNIGVNTVDFFFGFQVDPPPVHVQCGPAVIPFDTTFIIGPLPPTVYTVGLLGSLSSSNIPSQDLVFQVAPVDCQDTNGDIWVTNTQDEGTGSLRAAIECANTIPGPNLIRFHLPSTNDHKIRVGLPTDEPLPALTDSGTTIDGTTQPGFGDNGDFSPKIILDGAFHNWTAPINGLFIRGDNCKIFALEIINFPDDAIDVLGADNVVIGSPTAGNYIYNNGSDTDFFPDAPAGSGPWEGCGVVVRGGSQGCQIMGNIIGTNENLDGGLGNEWCAINVRDNGSTCNIGGPAIGQGNILAGNVTGVRVNNATNCLMQRNSFFCNTTNGIELANGGNHDKASPIITSAFVTGVSGTTDPGNTTVEVYINDISDCIGTPCQGRYFLGTASAVNGNWTLNPPFSTGLTLQGGERLTATASDGLETSGFSDCKVVAGVSACTNADGSIIVTTNADEGPGSLREAIECANNTLGANYIRFNIPGNGPHTIAVGETSGNALPSLTDAATVIEGSTQPGFGVNDNSPQIILDGQVPDWTTPINALFVRADFCEIYALQIINFPDDGIDLTTANYCVIGDVDKGNVIYSNGDEQDFFPGAPNTGPWNGCGIVLKSGSSYNQIKGNAIGTDLGGMLKAGNEYCGIILQSGSNFNTIGGTAAGEGNSIVDNEQGIRMQTNTIGNIVHQNEIFCNSVIGINLVGAANGSIDAPSITEAKVDTISGSSANFNGMVEVFLNDDDGCNGAPCQGKTYLGTATVDAGEWTLLSPFANGLILDGGESVTAVKIGDDGNSSEFAACVTVEIPCNILANVIDQQDASCGLANGYTTIAATAGAEPYFYNIGNGIQLDPTFNDLATGDYFITVTDLVGCTALVETTIGDSPVPTLSIDMNNDATCLQANGSFSAIANNGTGSYTYDIGNGSQTDNLFTGLSAGSYTVTASDELGCTVSLPVTISDNGLPNITVTEMIDPTCGLNNGSVTLAVTEGTPPYTYDIGNGPVNNPSFSDLAPNDYAIVVTDANGCSALIGVILNNQGVLPDANFTYTDVDGTVSFTNTTSNGLSYSWDFGDGNISTDENPIHTYTNDGDYMACLTATNACGTDVLCDLINILVPLADITISGIIAKENGDRVALAEVTCTNSGTQTTQSDGYYEFGGLTAGEDYVVSVQKNTFAGNGVSVLDLVLIQRHLLFVDNLDSPYEYIAADVTNNQEIGISDLVVIQRIVLLDINEFPNNTSWRFIPADWVFSGLDPFTSPFPEIISLTNVTVDIINQDFVAVKTGDVSGNANPNQFGNGIMAQLSTRDQRLKADSEISVSISSSDFKNIAAWQSDFLFDTDHLELIEVAPNALANVAWGKSQWTEGILPVVWHDAAASAGGVSVEDELLILTFKVLASGGKLSDFLSLKPNDSRNLLLDASEQIRPLSLIFETTTGSEDVEHLAFRLGQNQPNPFSGETVIPFVLPSSGAVELMVYDIAGRLLIQQKEHYAAGTQEISIAASLLPAAGLYFYEMRYEGQKVVRRMIVD